MCTLHSSNKMNVISYAKINNILTRTRRYSKIWLHFRLRNFSLVRLKRTNQTLTFNTIFFSLVEQIFCSRWSLDVFFAIKFEKQICRKYLQRMYEEVSILFNRFVPYCFNWLFHTEKKKIYGCQNNRGYNGGGEKLWLLFWFAFHFFFYLTLCRRK
jgi:hypothetical protein